MYHFEIFKKIVSWHIQERGQAVTIDPREGVGGVARICGCARRIGPEGR